MEMIINCIEMNIGIIIQARMGSTRLPGKILKDFYGDKTLLEVLLDNLRKIPEVKIIVATSTSDSDDKLESFLNEKGENVFRGSESDVLERFINAAETFHLDGIVRICSDNPFLDSSGIQALIDKAETSDADYIGFQINGKPSILTHFGFWGEFVRLSALKKVYNSTDKGSPAHEHVTYHIYTHPGEYKCEWIQADPILEGRDDIRLTVDTPQDFENAKEVYASLKGKIGNFSIRDVVDYLDTHSEIKESMKSSISQNVKK